MNGRSGSRVNILLAIVFITGGAVLIIEITAIRILSIYFGNTIYTDSGVISVILAALAAGYWRGGIIADKKPSWLEFFKVIRRGGVALAILFIPIELLQFFSLYLPLSWGPLAAALMLFFVPNYFLGMLSPFAVRLGQDEDKGIGTGTVSGKIFFWSTCGSITGTLLTSFVLIPFFGLNAIMLGTTLAVLFIGSAGRIAAGGHKHLTREIAIFLIVALALWAALNLLNIKPQDVVYEKDGLYQRQMIVDGTYNGRPIRVLMEDLTADGAIYLDTNGLLGSYNDYYALYKIFRPDVKNALFIGGGPYTMPAALHRDLPGARIDVAEIEPSLLGLAQKYFGVPNAPQIVNHIEDGRRFLASATTTYDMIFSDVYYSIYSIPPAYTTEEFFSLARKKLSPGGIFIVNIIGALAPANPSFVLSEIRTIRRVFPNIYVFGVSSTDPTAMQNIIVMGVNGAAPLPATSSEMASAPAPLPKDLGAHLFPIQNYDLAPYPVLTDNYAPVEYMIAKTLSVR